MDLGRRRLFAGKASGFVFGLRQAVKNSGALFPQGLRLAAEANDAGPY